MKKIFFLLLIILNACTNKTAKQADSGIIHRDTMISILTDINIAEAILTINENAKDSNKLATGYYKSIFDKHKTTKEQFETSFKYYSKNPELINKIYDEVINNLTRLQEEKK
ncbi:MAG: DUF4296 domain-containing protein [Bacteroidales bacterium]|nr:DUF4296 domain-containing protein [Bacteroidales bacterium]